MDQRRLNLLKIARPREQSGVAVAGGDREEGIKTKMLSSNPALDVNRGMTSHHIPSPISEATTGNQTRNAATMSS